MGTKKKTATSPTTTTTTAAESDGRALRPDHTHKEQNRTTDLMRAHALFCLVALAAFLYVESVLCVGSFPGENGAEVYCRENHYCNQQSEYCRHNLYEVPDNPE